MSNLFLHLRRLQNPAAITYRGVRIGTARDAIPRSVRSALFKGRYESHECDLVERLVSPGSRVLEIGTGIGVVSLLATRLAGEGLVLSCEANPSLEPLIRGNYALNGWTPNLRMQAVTADGRSLTFYQNDNLLTSSAHDRQLAGKSLTVQSVAIAELISSHRPEILIMDVEGAEVELLPAADLAAIRAIVVEVHPHIVGDDAIVTLETTLGSAGFRITDRQHKTWLLER